jgi:hypothetical protein
MYSYITCHVAKKVKSSLCLINHTMKMCGALEVQLHIYVNSALDGND